MNKPLFAKNMFKREKYAAKMWLKVKQGEADNSGVEPVFHLKMKLWF
jgi:hypothetical protein